MNESPLTGDDLYNSHEVIRHTCDEEQWADLEDAIKEMPPKELNYLNARLGTDVADNSDWHDYFNAITEYEWYRFNDAYHYATGTYYGS